MRNLSLDGIRALAVILVLLHHHDYLRMGWVGVDLFFVLSGYLITQILRKTRDDEYYWKEFWVKRVTRILPPLLVHLTLVVIFYGLTFFWLSGCVLSLGDVLAYFRPTFRPTLGLWSLAVEEHFYLLWPIAVRRLSRRVLMRILVVLILLEPVLRGVVTYYRHDMDLVYFLTPFRLDGLCMGSLMALLLESETVRANFKRWSAPACLLAMASYAIMHKLLGKDFTREGNTVVYNALSYFIIALVCSSSISYVLTWPAAMLSRALAWKPMVFVGTISYGLYLYQIIPIEQIPRFTGMSAKYLIFASTPVTVLFAWLSFRFYEKPIIRFGKRRADGYRANTGHMTEVSPTSAP